VTATSGTVVGGVTLTSAAYPFAVSSGPLTGGTCGPSDLTACPGIYAEDTSGNLWYYEGQSASGAASPLSGTRLLVGNVNAAGAADLPLPDASAANGTLFVGGSWVTDASPGAAVRAK